jgi:hypothetical protein
MTLAGATRRSGSSHRSVDELLQDPLGLAPMKRGDRMVADRPDQADGRKSKDVQQFNPLERNCKRDVLPPICSIRKLRYDPVTPSTLWRARAGFGNGSSGFVAV